MVGRQGVWRRWGYGQSGIRGDCPAQPRRREGGWSSSRKKDEEREGTWRERIGEAKGVDGMPDLPGARHPLHSSRPPAAPGGAPGPSLLRAPPP